MDVTLTVSSDRQAPNPPSIIMKRTFITNLPDQAGSFLRASRIIAEHKLNITRASYNKAIDQHTLFIEVEGSQDQLNQLAERLERIGYLQSQQEYASVVLVEFQLEDRPGAVTPILELIESYDFNITYISSHEDGSPNQLFKVGIYVGAPALFESFLTEASSYCPVRVVDYDRADTILDNSLFYIDFANEISQRMQLAAIDRSELLINVNQVMQNLDDQGKSFHKTFSYISGFVESLARYRGEDFYPRITDHRFAQDLILTLIEPPCGSNISVISHQGKYLLIDTGYACYKEETMAILRELFPNFDRAEKAVFLTHVDVDHCGLLEYFDQIYLSQESYDSFLAEHEGRGSFRESKPLHAPYVRICKLLTAYEPPALSTLKVIKQNVADSDELTLTHINNWSFGGLKFEVWKGRGGHVPGELVLIDREHKLAFTGDIFINVHEATEPQIYFNRYAPYLMTSVDTDASLCAQERRDLDRVLGTGTWAIFGGHGARIQKDISAFHSHSLQNYATKTS